MAMDRGMPAQMRPPILAAVSGGLDSVAMAWLLLSEGEEPVHIHHLRLRSNTARPRVEAVAMARIVEWLRANARPFGYTQAEASGAGLDIVRVSADCAAFAAAYLPRPAAMARASNAHDLAVGRLDANRASAEKAWRQTWASACASEPPPVPPPVINPVADLRRGQLWALLPEPLRAMTWSCRRPVVGDGRARSCGLCHTCRRNAAEGVPLNEMVLP